MKKRPIVVLFVLLANWLYIQAQISEEAIPYSISLKQAKATAALQSFKLKDLNINTLIKEDQADPIHFRYGVVEPVHIDLKLAGTRDSISSPAGSIWRMRITSDSAKSIQVILKKFIIPDGARLFVYNNSMSALAGAFTRESMEPDSGLVIGDVPGNEVVIEYNEPTGAAFHGQVILGGIEQAYKNILDVQSGSTYINVNCSQGRDLQLPKHAVCKITFVSGSSSYLCSGSLINNTHEDGTPYFLTAYHCISDSASASTLVAYFNFETMGCNGVSLSPKSLSGARLITTAAPSDYSLLLLNQDPPASYQPYFAGWDANGITASRVSSIHHPEGQTKKLCIDYDTITSNSTVIQWDTKTSSPVNSHWQVDFSVGKTGGGSSGGPLFNSSNQILGQLHGGDDVYDFYGKLSYSWTHSSRSYPTLKSVLDPDNSGVLTLGGYYPGTNPPDAFLAVNASKYCLMTPVQFTDYSVFDATSWNWSCSPATYSFTGGTSASSQNPVIEFQVAGLYSVSLKVANANGTDSMTLIDGIRAGTSLGLTVSTSESSGEACQCCFTGLTAWATGADNYTWSIVAGSEDKISLNQTTGDTIQVIRNPAFTSDTTVTFQFKVKGTQGTCSDSTVNTFKLIQPVNDNIADAVLLDYGKSATYSNQCATIQDGEPIPPYDSCVSQHSWCNEFGNGKNIVANSVWFKFVAGDAGYITISSSGFDDEMALYAANSYEDILNGNDTLVAANDDRSSSNYNALIQSAKVTPGKTYWIQVDGSGGNLTGDFYLDLTAVTNTAVRTDLLNPLRVYPQPATDMVYIEGNEISGKTVHITVVTSTGQQIYTSRTFVENGTLPVNIHGWDKGVYIAKIEAGNQSFVTRIVKY